VPIEDLEKYPALMSDSSSAIRNMSARFLKTFGDIIGIDLRARVPSMLLNNSPELLEEFLMLERIKRAGIIEHCSERTIYPDEPKMFSYVAKLTTKREPNTFAGGYSYSSRKDAFRAALGEGVERWCLNVFLPKEFIDAPYKKIKDKAINIMNIAGLSAERRSAGHPRFNLKYDEDSVLRWIKGYSLTREKEVFLPLQLVTFAYNNAQRERNEPMIIFPISNGAAAHSTLDDAVLNGLMEAIERDAFMISWVNRLSPPILDSSSVTDERLQKVFSDLRRYDLDFSLLLPPSDIPVHNVICVIKDKSKTGPAVAVGADSEFDFATAVLAAAKEALAVRRSVRFDIQRYAKEGRELPKDASTLDREGRLLWWSTPDKLNDIAFFADHGRKIKEQDLPRYPEFKTAKEKLNYLVKNLKEKDIEVSYAEILEKDLAEKLNMRAVFVVAPGLQPLHLNESMPYFWGDRMSIVPQLCGYKSADKPNTVPHPFP